MSPMKLTILSIIFLSSIASFAQTIIPDSAKNYAGKEVTVCGEIKGTYTSKSNQTVFMNFGADYPNQVFSVIIFADDAKKFSENPATFYKFKNVCVTGVVKLYKGKPEIVVTESKQIKTQ